ncbi:4'-phosphopantetheinyl transferase superfamily protein [Rhodobacteraceae bacterium D3-12]|nr:4'-phosphopantetheinyl transferase superfamily protein [Rhodobacteraceae bacterium D3-12]
MGEPRTDQIETALRAVLPAGVACAVIRPEIRPEGEAAGGDLAGAFSVEAEAMRAAVPKRRAEFFAGRAAARRAMAQLGMPPAPVPMGDDRAPVWPDGVVGSISHCEGVCVALIARSETWRSLSVDVEPLEDLPRDLWDSVMGAQERARLAELPEAARGRCGRLIFSAKEAVYKLQYPITAEWMEFSDLDVVVDAQEAGFDARFCGRNVPEFARGGLRGQILKLSGVMLCMMFLR